MKGGERQHKGWCQEPGSVAVISSPSPLLLPPPSAFGHCHRPPDDRGSAGRRRGPRGHGPWCRSRHLTIKKAMVANAAISASKIGLGDGPIVDGDGGRSLLLLLLFSPLGPFLGCLDSFLCNARGDGEHERGARPEY